jgi:flavin-dependent dehydrogenase
LQERPLGARRTLLEYLEAKGFQTQQGLLSSLKSHRYGVGGYRLKIPEVPVYLVGDAGGFAEAITGEGIYCALESGRMAGEVASSVHRGKESFSTYYNQLRRTILADTFFSFQISKWFYRNPRKCLRLLRLSEVWRPLVQGYCEGKTLTRSAVFFLPCLLRSIGKVRSLRR